MISWEKVLDLMGPSLANITKEFVCFLSIFFKCHISKSITNSLKMELFNCGQIYIA